MIKLYVEVFEYGDLSNTDVGNFPSKESLFEFITSDMWKKVYLSLSKEHVSKCVNIKDDNIVSYTRNDGFGDTRFYTSLEMKNVDAVVRIVRVDIDDNVIYNDSNNKGHITFIKDEIIKDEFICLFNELFEKGLAKGD